MHKVLVATDLHVTRPGRAIIGLNPRARLEKLLARAAADHVDAERLILLGDLTHWGGANEYAELAASLAHLPWPVHYLIGNHDSRDKFLDTFPHAARTDTGHVQEMIDLPGWRLVTLDSHDETFTEPVHSGVLCRDRLKWLDTALAGAGDRQVALFIHHPPMTTFFEGMDEIGLRNRDELAELIDRHGNVRQIIAGHIHRTISGNWNGIPVSIFKSPCHQAPLTIGPSSHDAAVDEPGAYGVLLFHHGGVTIHNEDVF